MTTSGYSMPAWWPPRPPADARTLIVEDLVDQWCARNGFPWNAIRTVKITLPSPR